MPAAETTNHAPERLPPQDHEAEMALLGSMMRSSDVIPDVLRHIGRDEANRFYLLSHRTIFATLISMWDDHTPIDIVTMRNDLTQHGLLETVGGVDYLIALAESVPSAVHAEHYARIVREKSTLRQVIEVCAKATDLAYMARDNSAEVLDEIDRHMHEVTDQRIKQEPVQIGAVLVETFREIQKRGGGLSGTPTGFNELDQIIGGLRPAELVIVGARPSMGKTALGMDIARNVAQGDATVDGLPGLFLSMEMSRNAIAERLLCSAAGVDATRFRRGMSSEEDIAKLDAASADYAQLPLLIDDSRSMSSLDVRALTRQAVRKHGVRVLYVDYLQLMVERSRRIESRQQEVAEISRQLKELARELNIPVIVLAQLNRNVEGRADKRPTMADLRESGAIEQDADTILLLHREEYYLGDQCPPEKRGVAEVIVAKQRMGPVGTARLYFDKTSVRFCNLAARSIEEDAAIAQAEQANQPSLYGSDPGF